MSIIDKNFIKIISSLADRFNHTLWYYYHQIFDVEDLVRRAQAHLGIHVIGELKVDMDFFTGPSIKFTISSATHELSQMSVVQDSDLKRYRQCAS